MPRYITIGYGDESGYATTEESLRNRAHEHDAWLASRGAVIGMAGEPVQVRNTNEAGIRTTLGPYLRSDLPVAGFSLVEADSLETAIEMVSKTPCAVAQGVVEVWPLVEALKSPAR